MYAAHVHLYVFCRNARAYDRASRTTAGGSRVQYMTMSSLADRWLPLRCQFRPRSPRLQNSRNEETADLHRVPEPTLHFPLLGASRIGGTMGPAFEALHRCQEVPGDVSPENTVSQARHEPGDDLADREPVVHRLGITYFVHWAVSGPGPRVSEMFPEPRLGW